MLTIYTHHRGATQDPLVRVHHMSPLLSRVACLGFSFYVLGCFWFLRFTVKNSELLFVCFRVKTDRTHHRGATQDPLMTHMYIIIYIYIHLFIYLFTYVHI